MGNSQNAPVGTEDYRHFRISLVEQRIETNQSSTKDSNDKDESGILQLESLLSKGRGLHFSGKDKEILLEESAKGMPDLLEKYIEILYRIVASKPKQEYLDQSLSIIEKLFLGMVEGQGLSQASRLVQRIHAFSKQTDKDDNLDHTYAAKLVLDKICTRNLISELLGSLRTASSEEQVDQTRSQEATSFLALLGESTIDHALNYLSSVSDIGDRKQIASLLAIFGKNQVNLFKDKLSTAKGNHALGLLETLLATDSSSTTKKEVLKYVKDTISNSEFTQRTKEEKRSYFHLLSDIEEKKAIQFFRECFSQSNKLRRSKIDEMRALAAYEIGYLDDKSFLSDLKKGEKSRFSSALFKWACSQAVGMIEGTIKRDENTRVTVTPEQLTQTALETAPQPEFESLPKPEDAPIPDSRPKKTPKAKSTRQTSSAKEPLHKKEPEPSKSCEQTESTTKAKTSESVANKQQPEQLSVQPPQKEHQNSPEPLERDSIPEQPKDTRKEQIEIKLPPGQLPDLPELPLFEPTSLVSEEQPSSPESELLNDTESNDQRKSNNPKLDNLLASFLEEPDD